MMKKKNSLVFDTGIRLARFPAAFSGIISFSLILFLFNDVFMAFFVAASVSVILFITIYYTGVLLLKKRLGTIHSLIKDSYKNRDPFLVQGKEDAIDELDILINDAERGKKAIHKEFERMFQTENYRKEFIGDISHELKTPIFSVQGYLETLETGALEDPAVNYQFLRKAMKNVNRLIYLTRDLMEISKLETGEQKPVLQLIPLNIMIKDVIDSLQSKTKSSNIKITFKQQYSNIFVLADRNQIRQVLTNLIDNAIKYNKPDGSVLIGYAQYEQDPSRMLVSVRDTGLGIAKQDLHRVTERFFRVDKSRSREQGGTGLGLAIVKHIIESHKEKLIIESDPGQGSKFAFTLKNADYHSD
ncbi:MAG: ATP-binding protein [Balneolales bacterium]